jgi:large subunit ribosomal protein L4
MSKENKTANTVDSVVSGVSVVTAQDIGVVQQDAKVGASRRQFAMAVRVLLQNWRQGTVGCKTRAEVNRTGRKPFKQKGTGRARAGTARSPLWRGGGVTFGPQQRVQKLTITRKARKSVMRTILQDRLRAQQILSLSFELPSDKPKTSVVYKALKSAGLADKKVTLFLPVYDYVVYSSFANISNVRIIFFDQPNVYDVALGDTWVFLQRDSNLFKEMVGAWS